MSIFSQQSVLELSEELFTVRDLLRFAVSHFRQSDVFYGHGTDNDWDEALSLVLQSLHLPMNVGEEFLDARLLSSERIELLSLFQQRIDERVPVPYLVKQAWFCGMPFFVDERVLIPRSPIGELIQKDFQPWYQGPSPESILDLCCGSGCIGIACADAFPDAEVVLADISDDALDVADINIERHQLSQWVSTIKSDLFKDIDQRFDLIVSNPPYVDTEDFNAMPDEFQHEPSMALTSGNLGLDHPLQILREASNYLSESGLLILEVGNSGAHLEQLYPGVDFNWVEFDQGGHGVLAISYEELLHYQDQLALAPDMSMLEPFE
ncbi:MAG: 50S ribosomal protein L3 N(5)-glutamine methyltransferase [Sinobacterium sp.]|nr:50S ribosomal protein L3 N(5)-glutamine methyltransferase [Sinobacterium sp.]